MMRIMMIEDYDDDDDDALIHSEFVRVWKR